ncbi:MAG: protease-4, partial [Limisphaerales bacterium]
MEGSVQTKPVFVSKQSSGPGFFKLLLASILGVFIAGMLVFFLFSMIAGAALAGSSAPAVPANGILKLNLNFSVYEQTHKGLPDNISPLNFDLSNDPGLNDIVAAIDHAADNDRIKGIMLELGMNSIGYTGLLEIRNALERFKAKEKFVVAYGQTISQRAYYLGSVADKVYLHPTGLIELKGLNAELSFYKGALEKLGVEVQVFYDGRFKSATEPFRLEKMSDNNRLQLREFLDEIWGQLRASMAEGRDMNPAAIQAVADGLKAFQPKSALKAGIVDALLFEDEVWEELAGRIGADEDKKLPFIGLSSYLSASKINGKTKGKKKDSKVAIIYAEGNIIDGEASPGSIGGATVAKLVRKARQDETVKAVVLRVNSGGGSALASDVIWREVDMVAKEKTLIVSMGDLAASGGYYIAAPADYIVAQPNTLTGSIGVFFMLPNLSGLMEDKLGINSDTVMTGAMADFPTTNRAVSPEQGVVLQGFVDSTYVDFKRKVAEGRSLSMESVESIAQGRIWTGTQAIENGLVDEL